MKKEGGGGKNYKLLTINEKVIMGVGKAGKEEGGIKNEKRNVG
jgi:hypothetical protein